MATRTRCPAKLLLYFVIKLVSMTIASATNVCLSLLPPSIDEVRIGDSTVVTVQLMLISNESIIPPTVRLYSTDRSIASVHCIDSGQYNVTRNISSCSESFYGGNERNYMEIVSQEKLEKEQGLNVSFRLVGEFLGRTEIVVSTDRENMSINNDVISQNNITGCSGMATLPVRVLRDKFKIAMDHIFVTVLSILLILANILMGCKLDLLVVWSVLRRPIAPAIGLISQFVFMPAIGYMLSRALFTPVGQYALALGIFTSGCAPGGGASNFWTLLLDGNVDLSITMTFISTVAALVLMPFWMYTLGRGFLGHIKVPYDNIAYSLVILVVPLGVGLLFRRYLPNFAKKLQKLLRPFVVLVIGFICTFGVYANWYMMQLLTWRVLVAGLCLPWGGFLLGFVAAMALRQSRSDVVAILIETGIQNSGVAILLLKLSFSQPEGDLASVMPVAMSIFTPAPLMLAVAAHCIKKCYVRRQVEQKEREAEQLTDAADFEATLMVKNGDCNGNHYVLVPTYATGDDEKKNGGGAVFHSESTLPLVRA